MKSTTWKYMVAHSVARFGPKKLGSITGGDIQQYYHDIASKTSYSTANRYHSLVRCLFNKAKSWGDFYGENPCARVTRQREPNHRLRFLDQGEMERLLAAADPRLRPVLVCALLTGMRRGELIRLKWEDIDLERNLIHIYQAKSGKPREIPISNKLHEEFLSLGPRKEGSAFDLPLIMLRRYYEKALRDAHIYGFRFHDLRHTFASHFIMKTCDLPALQSILGHNVASFFM